MVRGAALATLVLAGGEGRRIGGGKPRRLLRGRPLLDFALDAARGGGGPVALGVRKALQMAGVAGVADVELLEDARGIDGPLASVAAGLHWAQARGAAFLQTLPCDAPFLTGNLAARLLDCIDEAGAMAAVPVSHGQLHPSCTLWRVGARALLADYLATGRRSLQGFAAHLSYACEDWGAPKRDPFFNINTPEDLARAEAWLSEP